MTLAALGAETLFHRVAIKPGKPTLVARLGNTWVVGLPGNPASALVGWHLFARPVADWLGGDAVVGALQTTDAQITRAIANESDRAILWPARLEGDGDRHTATPMPWRGSHDVLAFARANALILLEAGSDRVAESAVDCVPLTSPTL